MNVKKILKVVSIGALLVGATFLAGCGPSEVEYQAQLAKNLEVSNKLDNLMAKNVVLEAQLNNLGKDNTALSGELGDVKADLEDYKLELTEKDKEVIALNEQIAKEAEVTATAEAEEASSYLYDELEIGTEVSKTFSDKELKLTDSEVIFDSDEYEIEEFVSLSGTPVANDDDYGEKVFWQFKEGDLGYRVQFDADLDTSEISEDEPLEFSFLGETVKVTSWDTDKVTFTQGTKYLVNEGEEAAGVKLVMVGDDYVAVKVGDETQKIYEGDTEKVGDIDIKVNEVLYQGYNGGKAMAELELGEDVEVEVEDGEEYADDSEWEWRIDANTIGLILVEDHISIDTDEDFKALAYGEAIALPKDFVKATFVGLTSEEMSKLTFEPVEKSGSDFVKVKGAFVYDMDDYDKVYVNASGIYDEDLELLSATEVEIDNTEFNLELSGSDIVVNDVALALDFSAISVDGTDVSSVEEKYRTVYGMILSDPESAIEDEKLTIEVPEEQLFAEIKLKTK